MSLRLICTYGKCMTLCQLWVVSGSCCGRHDTADIRGEGTPLTLIHRIGLHFRPPNYNHFPLSEAE